MLPSFRFLFAATLLTVSLLVFGLGAAALLRASHERFASMPRQSIPAPVFTQVSDAQISDAAPPTLSMLRVEQAPAADVPPESDVARPFDTLLPTDRIASLSGAPRVEEPIAPLPVVAEPIPEMKTEIQTATPIVEAQPDPDPEPVRIVTPVAPLVEPVAVAKIEEPAKVEAPAVNAPEPAPQKLAAAPEPEVTGSTPAPQAVVEPPLVTAKPIRKPPIPADRPAAAGVVVALTDQTVASPATKTAKPGLSKRKYTVKRAATPKRRVVSRPARPRPAAQNPASPFGASPFGT